jgi:hypothetical protein
MLTLQRQVGNSLINRMLAQREADTVIAREEEEKKDKDKIEAAAPDASKDKAAVAEKPAVKEAAAEVPEKKKEEEDESKNVMAKHDPTVQREGDDEKKDEVQAKRDPAVQRASSETADDKRPEVGMEGGPVSDGLASRIQASRGSGSPLDDGTRTKMEDGFGTSFDRVRVHTDGESDALNRKLGAKAFTTGNDVYMRQDASPSDQGLLAHELTHVVQQRDMSGSSTMHVGPAGDTHEQHADSMATAVTTGATPSTTQRQVDER